MKEHHRYERNKKNEQFFTQRRIECIDAMISSQGADAVKDFCLCNAFKYIWRTKNKNGIEDVDKAIWYLNKYKELSQGQN